jgi:hypothetical protein
MLARNTWRRSARTSSCVGKPIVSFSSMGIAPLPRQQPRRLWFLFPKELSPTFRFQEIFDLHNHRDTPPRVLDPYLTLHALVSKEIRATNSIPRP